MDLSSVTAHVRDLLSSWPHPYFGTLPSRVVMTAMTRSLADGSHHATREMADYYARRVQHGVGLVLTESIAVDARGDGFPRMPRLETDEQARSWRETIDAVHRGGGRIFAQLLHCGRITHADYTDGAQPVSATDRRAEGINRRNGRPYDAPRRLLSDELPLIHEVFRAAAVRAMEVGFDGIELHLAHGYLVDQFLDARINDRTDAYGGSIENRCRFAVELTELVLRECGAPHVMVRLSPSRWMDGLYDWPDLEPMVASLVPALAAAGLRQMDISCARADYFATSGRIVRMIRPFWPYVLVAGASLTREDAQGELDQGLLDMVTYGRWLIANADLVERMRDGRPLRDYDPRMLDTLE